MSDLAAIFSAQGILANTIPHYRARTQQLEMAQAIADTIQHQKILVAEAGTGTGKTFAYLVPTLLMGGKVIISTGTKTLQDQLYNRDIPTVRAALKIPVKVALLKGRANYICHYRLEQTLGTCFFSQIGMSRNEIGMKMCFKDVFNDRSTFFSHIYIRLHFSQGIHYCCLTIAFNVICSLCETAGINLFQYHSFVFFS